MTATCMPHTGSTAVSCRRGRRGGARVVLCDDLGEDRDRDLRRRARADVEPRRRVQLRAELVGKLERVTDRGAARTAGDERDVRNAGGERLRENTLLVATVRGEDHRGVAAARVDVVSGRPRGRRRSRRRRRAWRAPARSAPSRRHDPRCGKLRLEHDLERAAAQTRVVLDDRAVDRVIRVAAPVAGHEPKQQRLAGLEHAQRVQPDGRLRAHPADEPLDRAVAEHPAIRKPARAATRPRTIDRSARAPLRYCEQQSSSRRPDQASRSNKFDASLSLPRIGWCRPTITRWSRNTTSCTARRFAVQGCA